MTFRQLEQGIEAMAEGVALRVFAPDYYQGSWKVFVIGRGPGKVCSNYATAKAWADYLTRHKVRFVALQKV